MPHSAVVDTNLFVSGTILKRGTPFALLQTWQAGSFRLVIAAYQRREIERALSKPHIVLDYGVSDSERAGILRRIDEEATLIDPVSLLPLPVRDTKDAPILASALDGNAGHLVTGDADLLVLNGDPRLGTLRIVTARAFLRLLEVARDEPRRT